MQTRFERGTAVPIIFLVLALAQWPSTSNAAPDDAFLQPLPPETFKLPSPGPATSGLGPGGPTLMPLLRPPGYFIPSDQPTPQCPPPPADAFPFAYIQYIGCHIANAIAADPPLLTIGDDRAPARSTIERDEGTCLDRIGGCAAGAAQCEAAKRACQRHGCGSLIVLCNETKDTNLCTWRQIRCSIEPPQQALEDRRQLLEEMEPYLSLEEDLVADLEDILEDMRKAVDACDNLECQRRQAVAYFDLAVPLLEQLKEPRREIQSRAIRITAIDRHLIDRFGKRAILFAQLFNADRPLTGVGRPEETTAENTKPKDINEFGGQTVTEHDRYGRTTVKKTDEDGNLVSSVTTDSTGEVIEEITRNPDGTLTKTTRTFHADRRVNKGPKTVTVAKVDKDGTLLSEETKDADGNVLETFARAEDGTTIRIKKEDEGNRITRTEPRDDGGQTITETSPYEWTTVKITNKDDIVTFSETKDERGELVERFKRNEDGTSAKYTVDPFGLKRTTLFDKDGVRTGSRAVNRLGDVTRETYTGDGKDVKFAELHDKDGMLITEFRSGKESGDDKWIKYGYTDFDHDRGVKIEQTHWTDGDVLIEESDLDGNVINKYRIESDGRVSSSLIGSDAVNAFVEGDTQFGRTRVSERDWKSGKTSGERGFYQSDQESLDKQLLDYKDGEGEALTGGDIIVDYKFSEETVASRWESDEGSDWSGIENIRSDLEIKSVNMDDYEVRAPGTQYVSGKGLGRTPSEALADALETAAGTIQTHVNSEFIDHTKSAQEFGGRERWSFEKNVSSKSEHRSFVTIKDWKVKAVREKKDPDGNIWYEVDLDARRGFVLRK